MTNRLVKIIDEKMKNGETEMKKAYRIYTGNQEIPCPSDVSMDSEEAYNACIEAGHRSGVVFGCCQEIDSYEKAMDVFRCAVDNHPETKRPELGVFYCEVEEYEVDENGEDTGVAFEIIAHYGQPIEKAYRPWNRG